MTKATRTIPPVKAAGSAISSARSLCSMKSTSSIRQGGAVLGVHSQLWPQLLHIGDRTPDAESTAVPTSSPATLPRRSEGTAPTTAPTGPATVAPTAKPLPMPAAVPTVAPTRAPTPRTSEETTPPRSRTCHAEARARIVKRWACGIASLHVG